MTAIPLLVVDCGGYDVLGIAWRDLAAFVGGKVTATDGPPHIAPGVVSLFDAYAYADAAWENRGPDGDAASPVDLVLDTDKAIAIKGYRLPPIPPRASPVTTAKMTWTFLPAHGALLAVAEDGRTLVNWRALAKRLDGYTGPRPAAVRFAPDAPFTDTVDVRDAIDTLAAHTGAHWKIPQVLALLRSQSKESA